MKLTQVSYVRPKFLMGGDHDRSTPALHRWKISLIVAVLCALLLVVGGCGDVQDINQRILVYALGLDAAPGGEIAVSVHFLSPHTSLGGGGGSTGGGGGGGSSGAGLAPVTETATAPSMGDALDQLRPSLPGGLYLGSVRVILIGRNLAERGLLPVLDHLMRSSGEPTTTWMAVVNGRAEDLLRGPAPGQVSPARGITSILGVDSTETLRVNPTQQWQVVNGAWVPSSVTILPLFEASPNGPQLIGAAVLRGDRLVTTVNVRQAALLGAMNRSGTVQLGFPPPPGKHSPIAVKLAGFSIRLQGSPVGDTEDVTVRGLAYAVDSPEIQTSIEGVPVLEGYVNDQLAMEVRTLLAEMYRQRLDVLAIGEMVRERQPDGNLPQGWLDLLPQMQFHVRSEVRLLHGEKGL